MLLIAKEHVVRAKGSAPRPRHVFWSRNRSRMTPRASICVSEFDHPYSIDKHVVELNALVTLITLEHLYDGSNRSKRTGRTRLSQRLSLPVGRRTRTLSCKERYERDRSVRPGFLQRDPRLSLTSHLPPPHKRDRA